MIRVLFLLVGPSRVASSRVRVLQHLDALARDLQFEPSVWVAGSVHDYRLPSALSWLVGAWLKRWRLAALLVRTWFVRPFSLVFIHRLLLPPWIVRRLVRLQIPIVFDFDDALEIEGFHKRQVAEERFRLILTHAAHVTTSTDYNADQVRRSNAHVSVVMSSVNTRRQPWERIPGQSSPVAIGWIGSPSTAPYLHYIAEPLERLGRERHLKIIIVGGNPQWRLKSIDVIHRPWNEEAEAQDLRSFDIGVMPLPDNEWTRAKGGFKLIQYMAAGLPVVASPVGVNTQLVEHRTNGYLANTPDEWYESLKALVDDPALRHTLGAAGRKFAELRYDSSIAYGQLNSILKNHLTH